MRSADFEQRAIGGRALRLPRLAVVAFLAGMTPLLAACTIGNTQTGMKEAIGTTPKKVALLVDRLGPVIMSSQGFRNEVLLQVLASSNAEGLAAVDAKLDKILHDDDYAAKFARETLKVKWEPYPGRDGTFLGQWNIPAGDDMLNAFVRSQIRPVGDKPSSEANAWIRDNLIKVLQERYKVDFTDPIIRDALGPDLIPVTPGLGS